jgi:hypothetical protein
MARRHRSRDKYWIQDAVKRPGSLRAWLKRNKRRVVAAIKEDPFTRDGKIKATALKKLRNTNLYDRLPTHIKQKINLAITLKRLSRK